jgi:hypothetical protein
MRKIYIFAAILSILTGVIVLPPFLAAHAVYIIVPSAISQNPVASATEPGLGDTWIGYSLLKRICAAESNYGPDNEPRQFLPDGSVLWGWDNGVIVHRDAGECQINTLAHADELKLLGLDVVHNEADNIAYAKLLYDREGWRPWIASKTHWDPENLVK